jgi:hypothetical protein
MNESEALNLQKEIQKHNLWSALFDLCGVKYRTSDQRVYLLPCPCSDRTGAKSILFESVGKCTWSCTVCGASKNNGKWHQLITHLSKRYSSDDIFELAGDVINQHLEKVKAEANKLAERLKAYGVYDIPKAKTE